jgi:hypothetical protein
LDGIGVAPSSSWFEAPSVSRVLGGSDPSRSWTVEAASPSATNMSRVAALALDLAKSTNAAALDGPRVRTKRPPAARGRPLKSRASSPMRP